ncbi:sugar phosphate nucleotidyltransferase [Enterococcus sp. AZ192]|uniref:sugar phosphate nucleotidyltransferase n=1 Tax=unclassified Enterococcus TaxID=2608891 RepID=UPI003D2B7DB1
MKLILLSGGSGKRLWPLSNDQRSKQFIKLLQNETDYESMVQRVWGQIESIGLREDTLIATSSNQEAILKKQLEIEANQIIVEPSKRDTFAAIALASSYLYSKLGVSKNEIVIISPVDPYAAETFFSTFFELEQLLLNSDFTIGLIGIEPTLPSEKYGYIVPVKDDSHEVAEFVEKPNRKCAEKLIDNDAMWNAGVFAFRLSTILNILDEKNITSDFDELLLNYEQLPKNSFDYEVVEKQENIGYLRYSEYWKDLGTWNTLTDEMSVNKVGNMIEIIDSPNTHVLNELNIPVAVLDIPDAIVSVSADGILVSSKEESPRVKEIPKSFFEKKAFSEESWGTKKRLTFSEDVEVVLYEMAGEKELELTVFASSRLLKLSGCGTISYKDSKELIDELLIVGEENRKVLIQSESKFKFLIVTEK